jgi:diguanylate cyclase (GGDEF)-like protein/PAS domain S-box-containing protein
VDVSGTAEPLAVAAREEGGRRWRGPLLAWAIAAAAYGAWLASALLSRRGSLALDLTFVGLLAATSAWACRRTAVVPGNPAAASYWNRSALTLLLSMLGLLVETAYRFSGAPVSLREAPLPSNLLSLAAVSVALFAMLRVPVPSRSRGEWIRLGLDAGTVVLSIAVFGWYLMVAPRLNDRSGDVSSLLVVLGLAMVLGLVALVTVKVALAGQLLFDLRVQRLLILVIVFAMPMVVVRAVELGTAPQRLALAAAIPMHLLLVLAAERQRQVASRTTAPAQAPRRRRRPYSLLPYLSVAATLGLLVHLALPRLDTAGRVVLAGVLGLIGLVVARQLTALRDNARLLARLDASLAELGRHERRFRSLVQHSSDIIIVTDAGGAVTYASPSIARVLGHPPERWQAMRPLDLIHPDDLTAVSQHTATLLASPGATVAYQARMAHANGDWRWLETVSTNLLEDPSVAGIVTNARDVTTARQFQDHLRHQANHDALTGLANRSLFDQALRHALPGNGPVCVLLIDLDDFKQVNDRFGHAAGDQLLMVVAERLRGCVRHGDLAARLGGDEFALLLADADPDQGEATAARVLQALADPVAMDGYLLPVAASVGIAGSLPGDRADPDRLLRHADAAMYAAKRHGKGTVSRYAPTSGATVHPTSRSREGPGRDQDATFANPSLRRPG